MTLSLVTILSGFEINNFAGQPASRCATNLPPCLTFFRPWFGAILRIFRGQLKWAHRRQRAKVVMLFRSIPENLCDTVAAMWCLLDSRAKSIFVQ